MKNREKFFYIMYGAIIAIVVYMVAPKEGQPVHVEPIEITANHETTIEETSTAELESVTSVMVEETTTEVKKSLGIFRVTAYCPCAECCGKWADGITSTGVTATAGQTIAVDPSVIPYGSVIEVNGVQYVAEDCGGAIKKNRLDIFFNTHEEALEWGVQDHEVYLVTE